MEQKKYFIEGFINTALQDGIQTLMESDPNADFSYKFDQQAKHSLENYASVLYDLLEKQYSLTDRFRHDLLNLGGDLYIAAIYDPSYTFLDNEEGLLLLDGNRLDIYYYVDDVGSGKIGLDLNTY